MTIDRDDDFKASVYYNRPVSGYFRITAKEIQKSNKGDTLKLKFKFKFKWKLISKLC